MNQIENKVSDKYRTKKVNIEGIVTFLATINQIKASISSRSILELTAISVCRVWASASLVIPRRNIITLERDINEKTEARIAISGKSIFILNTETIM